VLEDILIAFLYERRSALGNVFPDDYRTISDNLMALAAVVVRLTITSLIHTDRTSFRIGQEWMGRISGRGIYTGRTQSFGLQQHIPLDVTQHCRDKKVPREVYPIPSRL
jgi:hypothetical protein